MPGRFAFLPNARTRLATDAVHQNGERLSLSYDLEITGDGAVKLPREHLTAQLRGPGDIIAIDRGQIARVEPEPGMRGFEPNYFPFIEFVDPDFPWRYSFAAGAGSRKEPWIILMALKPDEFEFTNSEQAPVPSIRVLSAQQSLPDLAQSWALAHVQVSLADLGSNVNAATAIQTDPARGFARLLCPRRLEERQSYFLFLVPAYQAGVDAGLGKVNSASPFNQPAWSAENTSALTLPFYFQSRFNTDTQEDLEQLLRRLRALKPEEATEIGPARIASSVKPGYYAGYRNPKGRFEIQTVLVPSGTPPPPFETENELAERMKVTLNDAISGEGDDSEEDPLVAFPPYGFRFRQETGLSVPRARRNRWVDRTNLDLKMRQAAAMGAQIVEQNQEFFSKLCWNQYEEIVEANRRLARLRTAEELVKRVNDKHFAKLDSDVGLSLAEPVRGFVIDRNGTPLSDALSQSGVPLSFVSRGLRRIAAKRPIRGASPEHTARPEIPAPSIPGDRTPGRTSSARENSRTKFREKSILVQTGVSGDLGNALKGLLGAVAFDSQDRPRGLAAEVEQFRSRDFSNAIVETLYVLPKSKAAVVVGGLRAEETKTIEPIFRSPEIPLPLCDYLVSVSPNTLISQVDKLPESTVTVFQENRFFVEAFMVGANHAMNDELRWREFPTDMRGTIFRRFWNRGRRYDDPTGDDIAEIHNWKEDLGRNFGPADRYNEANLVVVFKGDIVRKLRQPIIVINIADEPQWKNGKGINYEPIFFGTIGRDAAYFGFDVSHKLLSNQFRDRAFFVVYEPMGRLRFGLDVGSAKIRNERRVYDSLSRSFPLKQLGRSYDQIPAKGSRSVAPVTAAASNWEELSWAHMRLTSSGYVRFDRTISLSGPGSPGNPDLWGTRRTSASLARSCWQKPLAAVLPLKRVL